MWPLAVALAESSCIYNSEQQSLRADAILWAKQQHWTVQQNGNNYISSDWQQTPVQSAEKRLSNPDYQVSCMQGATQDDMASQMMLTINKCRPSCTHVFRMNKAFDWRTKKQNHIVLCLTLTSANLMT